MIQEKTYTTLEYDKILSILKQHLASEVGLEYAEKFRPVTLLNEAETLQEQTSGIISRICLKPVGTGRLWRLMTWTSMRSMAG